MVQLGAEFPTVGFERMHPGVYRISAAPTSWRQALLAACLSGGDFAYASHRAAAALLDLAGFNSGILEISTTKNVRLKDSRVIVHRIRAWPKCDTTKIAGIPITEPARTLIDLAAVTPAEELEVALDDALRRRLITLPRLYWRLETVGVHRKRGASLLTALVDDRRRELVLPESWLERKLIRFLADSGFPSPTRQFEVLDGQRFVGRVDFAYPERKLVIEADGYQFHSDPNAWERDRTRDNDLECLGWRVIRVTWKQLTKLPRHSRPSFSVSWEDPQVKPTEQSLSRGRFQAGAVALTVGGQLRQGRAPTAWAGQAILDRWSLSS